MAAWWTAKRDDYAALASYKLFEAKIRARFLPKGQKILALRDFFQCRQGRLSFNDYASALTEARNTIPTGSTLIPTSIFKFHLLFHSHPTLQLRIMGIHTFDIEAATLGIDNLVSLLSMQWDSLIAEGVIRGPSTSVGLGTGYSNAAQVTHARLPTLSDPERSRLTSLNGCWRCRKVPTDLGWIKHVGRTCPGDSSKGITPGIDYVAPADSAGTSEVKKEFAGAVLTHNNDGEDQPDPISRLHIGATFYTEDEDADDFIHPIYRKGALYDDDTDEES